MRYYDEIYSELIPLKFVKYITFAEVGLGLVFIIFYAMQVTGNFVSEDELPSFFFLIMAAIMFAVAALLFNLTKLRLGITTDAVRASFGFIKFEVPFSNVEDVYIDEKSSLKYGGWGVRVTKAKEGWLLAYTSVGHKRVALELKEHKYKRFIFSTAHPEEVVNVIKQQLRW
ncbi:MAG: hypothetical protein MUO90_01455 [Dehalococcoidales bacterium]|nr:hypothetical protein [Dehalococcoidales bacterium]